MTKLIPTISMVFLSLVCANSAFAKELGQFVAHADIGAVKHTGSAQYIEQDQHYLLSASGKNMWQGEDELHFVYRQMKGDFIVRANVALQGEGVDPHRKLGWNVRKSLATSSPNVHATVHGDGLTSLQFRAQESGETEQYLLPVIAPDVIQLERRGDRYIMSAARHGEPFQVTSVSHIKLGDSPYVGLSLCAHNPDVVETAIFSNVRVIVPAAQDFKPYRDYIGSNLEIMDMNTYKRRIVFQSPDSLQAPNWTRDGKTLIYNSKGLMFNFDLTSNTPSVLNTGFANDNNNDHVLSWDGKSLAISHHAKEEERRSTIYLLPLTGSDKPVQVTAKGAGHSFLHGFSLDDKSLIFTGERKGQYDIYSVDIKTGIETQLTDTATLDDGSEYSPDGKYIYFNSNRTGTMQLWRMLADGSNQEQLTFDHYNDWFPHVSPDGKKIVFLSFMDDIDSGDHPFYRHVYLREMSADGGEAKIIAYIYGGQGTINVPSWSPDGSKIAFISNSQM
jgi:Tol biopolymer transport system component